MSIWSILKSRKSKQHVEPLKPWSKVATGCAPWPDPPERQELSRFVRGLILSMQDRSKWQWLPATWKPENYTFTYLPDEMMTLTFRRNNATGDYTEAECSIPTNFSAAEVAALWECALTVHIKPDMEQRAVKEAEFRAEKRRPFEELIIR